MGGSAVIAVCSVLRARVQASVLTTTVEVGGPLWLDPENLPFTRRTITQIRRKGLLLQPHMTETTRDNRRQQTI